MKKTENPHFKSLTAQRFFYHFYPKVFEDKKFRDQLCEDLGLKDRYAYSFWRALSQGEINPSIEHIKIACEKHGLSLYNVFDIAPPENNKRDLYVLNEEAASFNNEETAVFQYGKNVGTVINEILTKHKTKRENYAKNELKMTPRNLQLIIAGDSNPTFSTVAKIAEDHGESLDLFRTKPLAKGHLLHIIHLQEERIKEQSEVIVALSASPVLKR